MLEQGLLESDLDGIHSKDCRMKGRWSGEGEACPGSQHPAVGNAWSRLQGGVGGGEVSVQATGLPQWPLWLSLSCSLHGNLHGMGGAEIMLEKLCLAPGLLEFLCASEDPCLYAFACLGAHPHVSNYICSRGCVWGCVWGVCIHTNVCMSAC